MTPIKVPGKKESGQRSALTAPRRSFSHSASWSGFKHPSKNIIRAKNKTKGPSCLERLPNELLEIIFFECLNTDLPNASPCLSSALSSFHVKSQFLFKAFESDTNYGLQHSDELINILGTRDKVVDLQNTILGLKWMTLAFLQQCIPIYLEKTVVYAFRAMKLQWKNGIPAHDLTSATVAELVKDAITAKEDTCTKTWKCQDSNLPDTIKLTLSAFHGAVSLEAGDSEPTVQRWTLLNCLEGCLIPEKLLYGPWTPDKCEFLEFLTRSYAGMDWIGSTRGEVAEIGFEDALKEGNIQGVRALMANGPDTLFRTKKRANSPDTFVRRYSRGRGRAHPVVAVPNDDGGPVCRRISTPNGIEFPTSMRHLRLAAIRYNSPKAILSAIRWNLKFRMKRRDPELTTWALQKRVERDPRGEWMLLQLQCIDLGVGPA